MAGQQVNRASSLADFAEQSQERMAGVAGTVTPSTTAKTKKVKPPKIIWPEKFKRAKKLPATIEEQPF